MLLFPTVFLLALATNNVLSAPASQDLRLQSTAGFEGLIRVGTVGLASTVGARGERSSRSSRRSRRQAQECIVLPSTNGTIRVLVASNHSVLGLVSTNGDRPYHGLVPIDHTIPLFVQIPTKDVFGLTTTPFALMGLSHLLVKEDVECRGSLEQTLVVQSESRRRRRGLRMNNGRGAGRTGERGDETRRRTMWTMECVDGIYLLDPTPADPKHRASSLYYDVSHNSFTQTMGEPSPSLDAGPVAEVIFQFVPMY